jgi:secondary thiamine-phosphate synthase enzyme
LVADEVWLEKFRGNRILGAHMIELSLRTNSHTEFLNIDREIQNVITDSGLAEGVCHIFIPHTTAGITINENADPDVTKDMEKILDKVVPWTDDYDHAEGNSAAHVKASMMGFSTSVLFENGRIQFGTWQSIYFCEFDGPRSRKVWIKLIGE